jgi:hypothetical protein
MQLYRLFHSSAKCPLSLVLRDLLHVWILYVLSLCYAIPSTLLLYQDTGLSVSLLVLLPATKERSFVLLHGFRGFSPCQLTPLLLGMCKAEHHDGRAQ